MARRKRRRTSARRTTTRSIKRRRRVLHSNPHGTGPSGRKRRRSSSGTVVRHRRRTLHRNPGILNTVKGAVVDGALVLGGRAGFSTLNSMIPFGGSTATDLAKGLAVVVGLAWTGRKFLPNDKARMLAAGAASSFVANLVKQFAPSMAGYLGEYGVGGYGPRFGGTPGQLSVGSFPGAGFGEADASGGSAGLGSYVGGGWG